MAPPAHESDEDRRRREARDHDIDRLIEDDRRRGIDRRQGDPEGSGGLHGAAAPSQMPGGVWLFNELTALRSLMTEQHGRIRSEMASGFGRVGEQLRLHEAEDRAVATRVALLEDRETRAAADATRRTIAVGSVVAAVVGPTAAALWKKLFGGP